MLMMLSNPAKQELLSGDDPRAARRLCLSVHRIHPEVAHG